MVYVNTKDRLLMEDRLVVEVLLEFQLQYLPLDDRLLFKLTKIPEGEFLIPVEAFLER